MEPKYGQVFDGTSFESVLSPPKLPHKKHDPIVLDNTNTNTNNNKSNNQYPIPPHSNGPAKSTIFVSIPHFRDGKRCGQTLQRLFATAAHPDRVHVGLIEQTDTEHPQDDPTCLDEYCKLMGFETKDHPPGVAHKGEKQADRDAVRKACPRAEKQIRTLRFHHLASKGPVYARSFARKLLGNEEFCMEIDAAMDFVEGWDVKVVGQWQMTGNEYGVLSALPFSLKDRERVESGQEVARQCAIRIGSEGVPLYDLHADGKAIGLTQPLLAYTHSSSFAFAKCHYETNVPHDPFAAQLLETEKFPRFARLWTRGYDVYTPSINIVYKANTNLHPLHHVKGHGEREERKWPPNDNERRDAHIRMKVLLGVHRGITNNELASFGGGNSIGGKMSTARANLGIYGLGKRRSMEQLLEFTGIALPTGNDGTGQHGNDGKGCTNLKWVPYDASISPRANLFDGTGKADDLDLDPEFPLRSLPDATGGQYDHPFAMGNAAWDGLRKDSSAQNEMDEASSDVPYSMVFLLWLIGLYVWYAMFVGSNSSGKVVSGSEGVRSRSGAGKVKRKNLAMPLAERSLKHDLLNKGH
mmetsp:Transcript_6705/g.13789  ORF Transcript_6705/g.13789 Transcript_6705/m.13789 type:complete len:581 (+) Transcript_6705:114-1856(+)